MHHRNIAVQPNQAVLPYQTSVTQGMAPATTQPISPGGFSSGNCTDTGVAAMAMEALLERPPVFTPCRAAAWGIIQAPMKQTISAAWRRNQDHRPTAAKRVW